MNCDIISIKTIKYSPKAMQRTRSWVRFWRSFGGEGEVMGFSSATLTCHLIMPGYPILVVAVVERLGLMRDAIDHTTRGASHTSRSSAANAIFHGDVGHRSNSIPRAGRVLNLVLKRVVAGSVGCDFE